MASKRSVKKYLPMLKGIKDDETNFSSDVFRCIDTFTREDRIVWAINKIKYHLISKISDPTQKQKQFLRRFQSSQEGFDSDSFLETFQHYLCQGGAFDNLTFNNSESVTSVLCKLSAIESKNLSKLKASDRLLDEEGEVIVSSSNDLFWFDLKKGGCSLEAKAMAHCGNGVGSENQTIFSLREKVITSDGSVKWTPHATFIYDSSTKSIGEMKGRYNRKPLTIHHEAIVDLLIQRPEISLLIGGGYKPQNNFAIDDLTYELQVKLAMHRPEFIENAPKEKSELYHSCLERSGQFTKTPWSKILLDQHVEQNKAIQPRALYLGKFSDMVKSEKYVEPLIGNESWIPQYIESFIALGEPHKNLLGKTLEAMVYADVEDIETILYQYLADIERTDKIHMNHLPERTMQILISLDSDSAYQLLSEAA